MRQRAPLPAAFLALAFLATLASPAPAQSSRDAWQRVPEVFAALDIAEGSRVADIGAGSGYFTEHLSRKVGSEGRVFSVDITERAVRKLRQLVREESLRNVTIIHSEPDDPKLPPRSLDAALIVNAYHDMDEYQAMLAGIHGALRPGGRLVIVDMDPDDPTAPRSEQTAEHGLAIDLAEGELRRAGFEVVERVPRFAEQDGNPEYVQWILVVRRPAGSVR